MTQAGKCERCGGQDLQPGSLNSTGRVGFRPDKTKFMVWHTADVEVKASICMTCGAINLTGDVEKTRAILDAQKSAAVPAT